MSNPLDELSQEVKESYSHMRVLPDGRIIGIHRLLFHWTMHVGINWCGYEERYCYHDLTKAIIALATWDGTGDPTGWVKHVPSGRTRVGADPAKEGHEWDNASRDEVVAMLDTAGVVSQVA